jgi:hypothetical protein
MNKFSLSLSLLFLILVIGCNSDGNSNLNSKDSIPSLENYKTENLPEVFKDYPVGIEVVNIPDTVYAELNDRGSKKYIWKHTTTIKAIKTDLKIIEFGTYNFKNGQWVLGDYTKKPFTTVDFDKWYCRKKNGIITFDYCIDGKIQKGVEYIDPTNFSIRKDTLVNRNGLWYYIGIDTSGNKFMGYGKYVVVDKLKN